MSNIKDNKDQPPVYNADTDADTDAEAFAAEANSQPTSLSLNFMPHNPQLYQPSQSSQLPHFPQSTTNVSVPQLDQYTHQHPQSQSHQSYYPQQSYQFQPNSPYEEAHYSVNTPIIPTTFIHSHSSSTNGYIDTSVCNNKGAGLTISVDKLPLLANFARYSNTHPVYLTMPEEYNSPDVLPDLSTLSSESIDIYYNTSNATFNSRTNTAQTILDIIKPIERHPFRRPSCCSVLSVMAKVNCGLLILSIIISICFGIFLYNCPSFETEADTAPSMLLGVFGLFFYLIYCCWFACIRYRELRYKNSEISVLQHNALLSDYAIVSNGVSSPSSYIYPPDIDQYINNLQHNVGPRLYLNILALEEEVNDKGASTWSTSYHALRPITILDWKDISIPSHEFLQKLEESGDNFYKIKYKYEYYLTPGQQKMLEFMTIDCQREERWRGKSVCVFVTYNTDLEELEKVVTSPFAYKIYNPTSSPNSSSSSSPPSIPTSDLRYTSNHPTTTFEGYSDDFYLPTSIPSYQRDDNNPSDKLVSYDAQAQNHYVLAYKEKKCCNILRTLFFNPILDWFLLLTVYFGFIYSVIYRYCIADYIYYNRKFLSISSQTNPDHDIVRLDVMPVWRSKPNHTVVQDIEIISNNKV